MATQRGWPDWIKGIALYGVTEEGDLVLLKADKEGNLSVQILPHAVTHQAGGSDEINVDGLKGVLADLQKAKWSVYDTRANFPSGSEPGELAYATDEKALYRWDGSSWIKVLSLDFTDLINRAHATDHQAGGSDEINVAGLHGELADPQPPKAHASSHQSGGSDEINVGGLHGELADPQPPKVHDNTKHSPEMLATDGSNAMAADLDVGNHNVKNVARIYPAQDAEFETADHLIQIGTRSDAHFCVDGKTNKRGLAVHLRDSTNKPNVEEMWSWDGSAWNLLRRLDYDGNEYVKGTINGVNIASHAARHHSGGDDPVDFLQLQNRYHAARHEAGGDDEITVSNLAGIEWKGVQIYSGVPSAWQTLDLSSHVGSRRALVAIRINHPGTYTKDYMAVPADWTSYPPTDFEYHVGPYAARIDGGKQGALITWTDSYGRIKVWTNSAESDDVWYLEWYIALT